MVANALITRSSGRALQRVILKGFRGFTLAEVLITLVIIGVIAAMTIPTLINKTDKQEYVNRFKKGHAVLVQALNLAQAQNGPLSIWDWSSQQSGFDNVENYIVPHLQIAENCKNTTNCNLNYDWKTLSGSSWFNFKTNTSQYKIVLNDGFAVVFYPRTSCVENSTKCMDIHIDVNGPKGPNKRGRDIFSFYVYPHTNDMLPAGIRTETYNSSTGLWAMRTRNDVEENCNSSHDGIMCGAKIILDGYKMNY